MKGIEPLTARLRILDRENIETLLQQAFQYFSLHPFLKIVVMLSSKRVD
jgi:hypothetical protein